MEPQFTEFENKLGLTFNNPALLMQAFTHRSYINENPDVAWYHNERLEFLGDAVLELAVTRYLFDKYPNRPEGELTAFRAALVNTISISEAAKEWNMNEYLLLSKGEAKDDNTKARDYILANTFEAVIGAIYLDQGYDIAASFIAKSLFHKLDVIVEQSLWRDAKSWVQEEAQEHLGVTPTYEVLSAIGPDHDKDFIVGIYFGDELAAKGEGKSKQEAQQDAARKALEKKKWVK